MSKARETSTDPEGHGIVDPFDNDLPKKPNWVDLAQLDAPIDDSLVNNLLYKPALRFHGLNSGLWGLGLSRTPSVASDSRPPSYKFSESINSKQNLDACSSCDQGSLYRKKSLTAVSPVTLRRRNTIAVILVAVALLAAVATITGIILHLMHPKELLRAHVRFTIANENFTDTLYNTSSEDFKSISRKLCSEMDLYYLTSELSDFYIGCRLISLRNDTQKPGLAVHYTIDFKENPTTNEKDRIKNVILRKSGRQASDANLYFVVRDYLVYLKSLRVTLEKVPTYHPDYNRPIIPWRDDMDFIARKSLDEGKILYSDNEQLNNANKVTPTSINTQGTNISPVSKGVLPNTPDTLLPLLNRTALYVEQYPNNPVNVSMLSIPVLHVNESDHIASTEVTTSRIPMELNHADFTGNDEVKVRPESQIPLREIIVDGTKKVTKVEHVHDVPQVRNLFDENENAIRVESGTQHTPKPINVEGRFDYGGINTVHTITNNDVVDDPVEEHPLKSSKITNIGNLLDHTNMEKTDIHKQFTENGLGKAIENAVIEGAGSNKPVNIDGLADDTIFDGADSYVPAIIDSVGDSANAMTKKGEAKIILEATDVDTMTDMKEKPNIVSNNIESKEAVLKNVIGVALVRDNTDFDILTDPRSDPIEDKKKHAIFKLQTKEHDIKSVEHNSKSGHSHGDIQAVERDLHANHQGHHHIHVTRDVPPTNYIHSPLEASFNPPNEKYYHMTETAVVDYHTKDNIPIESTTHSKIMTLSNDVFIIMGQSSKDYKDETEVRPTESPLFIQENPVKDKTSKAKSSPTKHSTFSKIPAQDITASLPLTNIAPASTSSLVVTPTSIPQLESDTTTSNSIVIPPSNMEIKEIVMPNTIRTNLNPQEPNIQWLNVLNAPHHAVNIHLDKEVEVNNPNALMDLQDTTGLSTNGTTSDTVNFALHDLLSDFETLMHPRPEFSIPDNIDRPLNQIPNVYRLTTSGRIIENHEQPPIQTKENIQEHDHNHAGIHMHGTHPDVSVRNDFRNENLNNPLDQHPNFRVHIEQEENTVDTPSSFNDNDEFEQHSDDHTLPSGSILPGERAELHHTDGQIIQHEQWEQEQNVPEKDGLDFNIKADDGNTFRQIENERHFTDQDSFESRNDFTRRTMDPDINARNMQWHENIMRRNNRNIRLSPNILSLPPNNRHDDASSRMTGLSQNPFQAEQQHSSMDVIHRGPIRWRFPERAPAPDSFDFRSNNLGRNMVPVEHIRNIRDMNLVDQLPENIMEGFVDRFQNDRGDNPLDSLIDFRPPHANHFPDDNSIVFGHDRRRSATRVHRPSWQKHFMFGIPVSTEFDGIGDIKNILKGIINSLFNMTTKIDKMQGAIDFINNTLHEENRPIFRLENTLQNMSASLDNLKLNLNNINKTLNGFKWFLQQFDNTIFDVGDVIKYLDETFDNLDKTVQFVGSSLNELNGTVDFVDDVYIKGNESLVHLNKSAVGVKKTTNFANKTLDSMTHTLASLENAVDGLNLKVDEVFGGIDDINISLKSMNDTVHNSYRKMNQLNRKMNTMNSTVDSIEQTVARLNETYKQINEVLAQMNESFVLINGTTLDVIRHLIYTDDRLSNISNNMDRMRNGMLSMNTSLRDTIDWMGQMVKTLDKFTSSLERRNDSIVVNLENTDLIETLSILLGMNDTLFEFGNNVDHINKKLNNMENTLFGLEANLDQLKDTLSNVNVTFKRLNDTLETTNTTIKYISKALGNINQSIDAMNRTSTDLNSIFGSIDKTLDIVNSTIIKVKETGHAAKRSALSVNSTLLKTKQRINNIMDLTKNVSNAMINSEGSLPELNNNLYNANESIRVIHSKTEIVSESYDMLNDNLAGIEKNIANLFEKLDETESNLKRVNTSFVDANDSIRIMDDTKNDWKERLDILTDSFQGMNDSMKDIGSAFPNLMNNLNKLHKAISHLQSQIEEQSEHITTQKGRKEDGYNRYLQLKAQTDEVRNALRDVKMLVDDIKNFSKGIDLDIRGLKEEIKSTNNIYENMENNLNLLDRSLSPLQARFDEMLNDSQSRQAALQDLVDTFSSNIDELKVIQNETRLYSNIKVPFRDLEYTLMSSIKEMDNMNTGIEGDVSNMRNKTTLIWDEIRKPVGINLPFEKLLQRMNSLNMTMDNFSNLLQTASNTTMKMTDLNDNVLLIFRNISSMKNNVDLVNEMTENTTDVLRDLDLQTENKVNHTEEMLIQINSLIDLLEVMKMEYGNINGTQNNTYEDYVELEKMLQRARNDVLAIGNELKHTKEDYLNHVHNFTRTIESFRDDKFGIDEYSHSRMQGYISNLTKGRQEFNKTALALKDITTDVDYADKFVDNIERLFKSLKTDLTDKVKSYNFLNENKPRVVDHFERTSVRFLELNETLRYLNQSIKELFASANNTEHRSKLFSNVDIVLDKEYIILHTSEEILSDLNRNMTDLMKDNDAAKLWFERIDNDNMTFLEVKREFTSLNRKLHQLNATADKLVTESNTLNKDLQTVSHKLKSIGKLLDKFNASRLLANSLYDDVKELNQKVVSTGDLLSNATSVFQDLKITLAALQSNYTNFTATRVNLSESFILDTIEEMQNTFQNLSHTFDMSKDLSTVLLDDRTSLIKTMDQTTFDRTNIDDILDNKVSKLMREIRENSQKLHVSLDDINSKVHLLNITLIGVNDAIHATNEKLFIDRQKKLLADSKFPDLEKKRRRLNDSIEAINKYLIDISENVTSIMDDHRRLDNRLDQNPNVNVSINDLYDILLNLTGLMTNGMTQINNSITDLNKVKNILWTENGRRYTENETIAEMKDRYKQAADTMEIIDNLIMELNNKLNNSMLNATLVHNDINSLDKALDAHDSLNGEWNAIQDAFVAVTNHSSTAKLGAKQLGNRLEDLHDRFNNLSDSFSHINQSVFTEIIAPFDRSLAKSNESYQTMTNYLGSINTQMEQLRDILNNINNIQTSTINDKNDLEDTNINLDTLFTDFSRLHRELKETLDSLSNDTEVLTERIVLLDDDMIWIKESLERQEKQEFYEKNSPLDLYKRVSQTLQSVAFQQNDTANALENVKEHFSSTKHLIDSLLNVDISTDDMRTTLGNISYAISIDGTILEKMISDHKSIKNLLNAANGLPYAENETIDEMKRRYKQVYDKLEDLVNTSKDISKRMDVIALEALPNKTMALDDLDELLNEYKLTGDEIDQLQIPMDDLENVITSETYLNVKRQNRLNKNMITFDNLQQQYKNISSLLIANSYDNFKRNANISQDLYNNINETLNKISDIYKKSNMSLNLIDKAYNKNFTSLDQLEDFLSNFTKLNESLHTHIVSMEDEIDGIQRNVDLLDRQLGEQENVISNLQNLLEKEEKERYVAKVTEEMQRIYNTLLDDINSSSKYTQVVSQNLDDTNDSLSMVQFILTNMTNINIPIEDVINKTSVNIELLKHANTTLKSVSSILKDLSISIQNINKPAYIANNTLDDIKLKSSNLTNMLGNMGEDVSSAFSNISAINNATVLSQQFLQHIINQSNDLKTLTELIKEKTFDLNLSRNRSERADDLQKRLHHFQAWIESNLTSIPEAYKSVDTVDLWDRFNSINESHINLRSDFENMDRNTKLIQDLMNKTNILNERIISEMGSPINNLDQLKMMNNRIRSLLEESQLPLTAVNSSIQSQIALQDTLNDNLIKNDILLNGLDEDFKQQLIMNYIRSHFPTVMDKYSFVNDTIVETGKKMSHVNEGIKDLYYKLADVNELVKNHPVINIPLMNNKDAYESVANRFQEVLTKKDNIVDTFKNLSEAISQRIGKNDSLESIEKRFGGYNKTLNGILKSVVNLNSTSDNINNNTFKQLQMLLNVEEQLGRFEDIRNDTQNVQNSLDDVGFEINKKQTELNSQKGHLKMLNDTIKDLKTRFKYINDSKLNQVADELIDILINASVLMDHDILEVKKINHSLSVDDTSIKDINAVLDKPVSDFITLNETLNQIQNKLSIIKMNTNTTTEIDLPTFAEKIEHRNLWFNEFDSKIKDIHEKFLKSEKEKYLNKALPELLDSYKALHTNLSDTAKIAAKTSMLFDKLNTTLTSLAYNISNDINIDFNISDLHFEADDMYHETEQNMDVLKNQRNIFNAIDERVFTDSYWNKHPLHEIKTQLTDIESQISDIYGNVSETQLSDKQISNDINKMISSISKIDNMIERYRNVKDLSEEYGKNLSSVAEALGNTQNILENLTSSFSVQNTKREELLSTYKNVTSPNIERIKTAMEQLLLDTVGLRLPMLNKLFQTRMIDWLNEAESAQRSQTDILDGTHTLPQELEGLLNDTEKSLADRMLQSKDITSSNANFNEEAIQMVNYLNESESLLIELENTLRQEEKTRIFRENLPRITSMFDSVVAIVLNTSKEGQETLIALNKTEWHLANITHSIDSFDNINISTNLLKSQMQDKILDLQDFRDNLTKAFDILQSFSPDRLNESDLIKNTSVKIDDVYNIFDQLEDDITRLENETTSVRNDLLELNKDHSSLISTLNELHNSLERYENVQKDVNKTKTELDGLNNFNKETSAVLNQTQKNLKSLNTSLQLLQAKYKSFKIDTSTSASSLTNAYERLANLTGMYADIRSLLEESNDEFHEMESNLTSYVDNGNYLNKIITAIEDQMPLTEGKMGTVRRHLVEIKNKIPSINASIEKFKDDIHQLNKTFINEEKKRRLSNEAMPQLQDKYKDINMTFEMTNKSLQIMQANIAQLENYILNVKANMDKFESINISMSSTESNLTQLEDRLTIMKEHYNNVHEVVVQLQRSLKDHDVSGKNVSLNDTKLQYQNFNETLDQIDTVLQKIDVDVNEMDYHLMFINDTLVSIDAALTSFENEGNKSKDMDRNLDMIRSSLNKTNTNINEISATFENLNDSFVTMQDVYKDVLGTTAENNTQFAKDLTLLQNKLDILKKNSDGLYKEFTNSSGTYKNMNETLFKNISSLNDLNKTLSGVKETYSRLSYFLDNLNDNILRADNKSNALNASLENLGEVLSRLNETLYHEQMKFNFLASNFGGLQAKTQNVESYLNEAEKYISTVKDTIQVGNTSMDILKTRLNSHKNLNISLDPEGLKIQKSFQNIDQVEKNHTDLRDTFSKLINNLTSAQDRSGKISDIKQKYNALNQTLDTIDIEIQSLNQQLGATNNDTLSVNTYSKDLLRSIEEFENVSIAAIDTLKDIQILDTKLQRSDNILSNNNDSVSTLEKETHEMVNLYSYVDDQELKANLSSMIKELAKERKALKELNDQQAELRGIHSKTANSSDAVQGKLTRPISSKFVLDSTVADSAKTLEDVSNSLTNITSKNKELETGSLTAQNRIRLLEERLRELNDTLFEEKIKIDFVKQNFPGADARYKILNNDIRKSESEIKKVSNSFHEMNNSLNDISSIIESFSVVQIPLDIQRKVADSIQRDIDELKDMHTNITSRYASLNVSSLQDRQRSYNELKGKYDSFDSVTNDVSTDVQLVVDRLRLLNKKLQELNITMIDMNSTLGTFANTKGNATALFNKMNNAIDDSLKMNKTVSQMENTLNQLNNTIKDILTNFTDVKDPILIEAKDSIQRLLEDTVKKISLLKDTTNTLDGLHNTTEGSASQLNETLLSKKLSVDNLKADITTAWGKLDNISALLNNIYDKQANANKTSTELNPQIQAIVDKMKDLYTSYEKEQSKLDFIKDKKPALKLSFKQLKTPLNDTNKRISNMEIKLADLQISISSVGDRLNRFNPIRITTKNEIDKWQNLSKSVRQSSKEFIQLSKIYQALRSDMEKLDDRNKSITDIKILYAKINETVDVITNNLSVINNKLDGVKDVSAIIEKSLSDFETIMDKFKTVQSAIKTAKMRAENASKELTNTNTVSSDATINIKLLQRTIKEMEGKYKILSDKQWESTLPLVLANISSYNETMNVVNGRSKFLNKSIADTAVKTGNALSVLKDTGLTRTNAEEVIGKVNRTVSKINRRLTNTKKDGADLNRTVTTLHSKTIAKKAEIDQLNHKLANELKKYNFVNQTLPDLREKYKRVNTTFVANVPDVKFLQGTLDGIVDVISKIKDKMIAFDRQDTDKSVHNWDQAIVSLNKTVNSIIDQNKKTSIKLKDLKEKLWKTGRMYSKNETLKNVKARYNGYNKTLDEIMAAVHRIEVKLTELDNTSQDLAITLENHEAMLTTTPEPLGPPHWLQFTSTDVGTIGKDHGMAECSVGDLLDWEVMRISRQRGNEKEKTVAAWKLGLGARKTIQDRRLTVKKMENSTGGSLSLNIRSLQCEDEAAYYCYIDTYSRYPLRTDIAVITPPEDSLDPDFPTEVFEDKIANFSCTGHPGYPSGRLAWKVKHEADKDFKNFDFYSAKPHVTDTNCIRTETNRVEYQFNMSWNNTKIRCYIENTTYFGEGIIRLLPYDICNRVRFLGTISHPYTPHKYIVCGKELNIMQCPGDTCYDTREENCVRCKAGQQSADPCHGKPLYSYVAHEKDCKKYYICMGPTKTVKKCTKGYFNPNMPGNCAISYAQSYCAQRSG